MNPNTTQTNKIPQNLPRKENMPHRSGPKWTIGCYGFTGFFGFWAFNAFPNHNPLFLFLFGFFTFFSMFRYWKDELKYFGFAGVLGLIVPALWALGLFKV
jgi:hypothetical protein